MLDWWFSRRPWRRSAGAPRSDRSKTRPHRRIARGRHPICRAIRPRWRRLEHARDATVVPIDPQKTYELSAADRRRPTQQSGDPRGVGAGPSSRRRRRPGRGRVLSRCSRSPRPAPSPTCRRRSRRPSSPAACSPPTRTSSFPRSAWNGCCWTSDAAARRRCGARTGHGGGRRIQRQAPTDRLRGHPPVPRPDGSAR